MLTTVDRHSSKDPTLQQDWWPERPCEEPQPYEEPHLSVVRDSLRVESGLPRGQQMTLAVAVYRSTHQYHYGRLELPEAFEIQVARAVAALERAQRTLGREFCVDDIQLSSNEDRVRDFNDWMVQVLLCGAPIAHCFLGQSEDGMCPDNWMMMPECPLMVFADDIPRPGDQACWQDLIYLERCPPPADCANQREALARMFSDEGVENLRLAAAEEMLPRVRRRLAIGGHREIACGWRAAVPADIDPPIRWPRRLRRRKVDGHPFRDEARWWVRGRVDADLPVGQIPRR